MDEATTRRHALVDELKQNRVVTHPAVEAALRDVPRHLFLPELPLAEVYSDRAIPTKLQDGMAISSSSQPAIMAIMLEQLDLRPGQNVLEIGAGTGYNAALMARLVGGTGRVTTVDIDEDIVAGARENLTRAGASNVQVVCADGAFGYAPHAPYDAIIATVGVWDLPPYWLEQLRAGGLLVAPLSFNTLQFSIAFRKRDDVLASESIRPCGFMRLRGAFAGPETYLELDGIIAGLDTLRVDAETLTALLAKPSRQLDIPELQRDQSRGFIRYLALRGEPLVMLMTEQKEKFDCQWATGLVHSDLSLVVFIGGFDGCGKDSRHLRVFGDESGLARVMQLAAEWRAHGSPDLERASIRALPLGSIRAAPGTFVIRKRWMEYKVNF